MCYVVEVLKERLYTVCCAYEVLWEIDVGNA